MSTEPKNRFNSYWQRWAKKRNTPGNPQAINARNLYILPTGFGWAYALVVVAIFLGAVNSQINMIFLMAFLLVVVGMVSAWEANANLKNLTFRLINTDDAQQGKPVKITLSVQANNKIRYGLEFQIARQNVTRLEVPTESQEFIVPMETTTRGYFPIHPIAISSLFPFGIFRVWSYAYFEDYYYVYPEPVDPGFWPEAFIVPDIKQKHAVGDEDFYDLKQVENPWTEPKLIHWKIAAKGQGWYHKVMDSNEVDYWLFRLDDLPAKDLESNLQHLSYWLQTAEVNGLTYGLELKSARTRFSRGAEHLQHCLRQLALYQ